MKVDKHNRITSVPNMIFAIGLVLAGGLACNFNFSAGEAKMPERAELNRLVQETMSDFAEAVDDDDFADFIKKASREFQKEYKPDQMSKAFEGFVKQRDRSVPILRNAANATPEFSSEPLIRKENDESVLVTSGKLGDRPAVNFNFDYVRQSGKWKLIKIEIKV